MNAFEENVNGLYDQFEEKLAEADCEITPPEFQGILAGLISAGLALTNLNWLDQIGDLINENNALSDSLQEFVIKLYKETHMDFSDDDLLAPILIPDDSYPMVDRLEALSFWSQGYLLGFGLQFGDKEKMQKEVSEALVDIAEISQVNIENTDNEESNIALETLIEHIKVAVKMIYMELVKKMELKQTNLESHLTPEQKSNPTIH